MREARIRLSDMLATFESSIRECLTIIDKHGVETIFVIDRAGRLAGVVGDRHLRKALVDGANVDDSIGGLVDWPATLATPGDGRAEVLDVMRALGVGEIPIVDGDGRVVGVHVDHEIIGSNPLENWAVVMAGGRGTRLAPLTDDIPKPMIPVAGRPILERIVLHLVGSGIRRIFLSVNYLGDQIEEHFGDGAAFGCAIQYLRERPDQPLGTGGALGLLGDLGERPPAPVLVMNGDLVTGFAVSDLLGAHVDSGALATIATSEYEHQVPFGVLESSGDRLVRMVEKPTNSWPVNAGIYVVSPVLLTRVPRGELYPITRLFDECLARGESVGLWPIADQWQDIGRPRELARARGQS